MSKKRLKVPKGFSESIKRRRTDNTMAKKRTKGQTKIYIYDKPSKIRSV
jgi:hypothetical protein